MATYTFEGYPDNTDLGAVTGWARLTGNALDINVDADGKLDFTAPASDAAYGAEQGSADHDFAVTYATFAEGVFFPCCVRITDSNNFIGARVNGGNIQLFKRVSGTFTQLGSSVAHTGANGDLLKITSSGNTLNVYMNGVLKIGPITDSAHNTVTKCGMVARSTSAVNLIESAESTVASTAPNITSISSSNTIYANSSNVVVTGTSLIDGLYAKLVYANQEILMVDYVTSNTQPYFTSPSLADVFASRIQFTDSANLQILNAQSGIVATKIVSFQPPSTKTVHNVTDISQAGNTGSIYYGQSPAITVGDQIVFDSTSLLTYNVSLDSQGFSTIYSSNTDLTDSFTYRIYESSSQVWGTEGTITFLGPS